MKKYAKIENGEVADILAAGQPLTVGGRTILRPSERSLASAGYCILADELVPVGRTVLEWRVVDGDGVIRRAVPVLSDSSTAVTAREPRKLSKERVHQKLIEMGTWDEVKAMLNESGAWDSFVLCTYILEDNPQFVQAVAAAKAKMGLSDEAIESFIADVEDLEA